MSDEERSDGADEQRDERGRLYSVVAEGRRFYYVAQLADTLDAVSAELAAAEVERDTLRAENERWRERVNIEHAAVQECMEHEVSLVAERDSLRGVVQRVWDALGEQKQAVWKVAHAQQIIMDAGLAAAADAPQPEDDRVTCPNTRRHMEAGRRMQRGTASYKRDQLRGEFRNGYESDQRTCDYCWPPCPTCGHRKRRPSPAVLPEKEQQR